MRSTFVSTRKGLHARPLVRRDHMNGRGRKSSDESHNAVSTFGRSGLRPSGFGQQARQHVLGAVQVVGHDPRAPGSRRRRARRRGSGRAARCCAAALRADAGCARSGRSSRPGPRSSRPRAGRCRRPRPARCGSARRRAGRPRSRRAGRPCARRARERAQLVVVGALAGERHRTELDRQPHVADLAPAREHLVAGAVGRRQRIGDERPAAAPAHRVQVAALGQRGERLAQRRAGDAQPRAQLALGRQPRPRGQQAELDRRAEPVDGLLEGGLRPDRREDRVERRVAVSLRAIRCLYSRSKPRTRSQSVTAASNASSSTRALFR